MNRFGGNFRDFLKLTKCNRSVTAIATRSYFIPASNKKKFPLTAKQAITSYFSSIIIYFYVFTQVLRNSDLEIRLGSLTLI